MKNIFSLFVLMLFAEQFCFATITNSSDTITIVQRECKASVIDGDNSPSFSLTYFEFDSLPIPLRDSVKNNFSCLFKEWKTEGDTMFDIKKIAVNFISNLEEHQTYNGQFSVVAQTNNYFTVEYSSFVKVPFSVYGSYATNGYLMFDKRTGKVTTIEELFEPKNFNSFKKLDYTYLKANEDTNPTKYEELLNEMRSFSYLDKKGLHRVWMPGRPVFHNPMEYVIPMKELKPLLRKDFEW